MKKILILGELNQTVSNLNRYLAGNFQTQVCATSLELIKGMVKISKPDLVLVCLVGSGKPGEDIISFFSREEQKIPLLFVGTEEECKDYYKYNANPQCDFAIRPITQAALLKKCSEMVKINGFGMQMEADWLEDLKQIGKSILIVDDSSLSLRNIKSILDKRYDITVAMSGEKAVSLARRNLPDLILLDYEMPGWDGRRTLEEIRKDEKIRDIPVVFLTGMADKEHIAAVLGLNPAGYLLKPIEKNKLLEAVEQVLKKTS